MWRGNNNHNTNNNHRGWRPNDRGWRQPRSAASNRSFGTALSGNANSTTDHTARRTVTAPGGNGFSGNSREDWGLMGDTRPPTPSEGRAQYYHRIGDPEQQRTRTYDNGTALTFGPDDPIPDSVPGASFDDQFRQVDAAIRELQVSNIQGPRPGSSSNDPYQNFRTSTLDPRRTPAYRFPDDAIYRVVPSRYASVEVIPHVRSLVRHLAEQPGSSHPGDSTDTRFGENRPNTMSRDSPATSSSDRTVQQDNITQLDAQSSPNVAESSGDIAEEEEGPIHESRGTFYSVPRVLGYPPPLPIPGLSNVTRSVRDISGRTYEVAGYESGSMMNHHPNVANNSHDIGSQGYQSHGYGYGYAPPPPPQNTSSNVPSQSQDIENHYHPGYVSAARHATSNVTTIPEDFEEPRGRTIERDPRFLRHHRRTAQRGNVLWGQELDERNEADRARGETILGGDVDSGEFHTFVQFQVPAEQRAANEQQQGLTTPRALSPPQVRVTEPSPIAAMPQNTTRDLENAQTSGRSSAPPAPTMGSPGGYFFTPLYQALNAQDTMRRSSLPAIEGRSSSVDSNGENRIFGELAGTVRAPSLEGKGRKLWKKNSDDEEMNEENAKKGPEQ